MSSLLCQVCVFWKLTILKLTYFRKLFKCDSANTIKGSHTFNPLLHLKISLSYFHGIPWPILIYNKINIRIDCTLQIWSSVLTRSALQPMPNNEWKNVHTVIEPSAAGLHFKTKTSVATKIFSTEKNKKTDPV
jgi:hypothetical protein